MIVHEEILHSFPKEYLREMLFLSKKPSADEIGILPGTTWGLHYRDGVKHASAIEGLLRGKLKPDDAASDLEPDALVFNANDLSLPGGFSDVNTRILRNLALVQNYDWHHLADFLSRMKGLDITPDAAQRIYEQVVSGRIESQMIQSFVGSGSEQIEQALRAEGLRTVNEMSNYSRIERVMGALKLDWLAEDRQLIRTDQRDQALTLLDDTERELFNQMRSPYREFTKTGKAADYEKLTAKVIGNLPILQEEPEERMSDSMKDLGKELEQFRDKAGEPGSGQDPGIPPEYSDTYDPRPDSAKSKETGQSAPWFEISPAPNSKSKGPLLGNYAYGRCSYYDGNSKNWSNNAKLSSYSASVTGDLRQTISGTLGKPLTSIPLPNNYALDVSSLKYSGTKPEFARDQNGCFFVKVNGQCQFRIDFLPENPQYIGQSVAEDLQPIHKGNLSPETEKLLAQLKGSALEKADMARQYILDHHFYPGGGDLQMAHELQVKLRGQSSPDNYIQNLDKSEYLECYSANTLLIALVRKAGIHARLVVGHKVQSANQGKAVIDGTTGHAWAEIWDGIGWRRVDATPQPKPQDKKKQDEKPKDKTPTENANDGGIEAQTKPSESQGEEGSSGSGTSQLPGEASEKDMKDAQSNLDKSQKKMEKMEKSQRDLKEKVGQADKVKDLKELEERAKSEELLDDMKEELEEAIENKKDQLTDDLKDKLDEMARDGFLDEKEKEELKHKLEESDADLDDITEKIEEQNELYAEYLEIKKEIMPLVNRWYQYFTQQLPKEEEPDVDEEMLGRAGMLAKKALKRPGALMTGRIKHPKIFRPEVKPLFLASVMVDVSGSMSGTKLEMGRKLLVFYNELFSRISEEYGYIRYANYTFSDDVSVIKSHDQDYNSPQRYDYGGGIKSTVKARLMQAVKASGGTNMFDAIKQAANDLNKQAREFPDYASAFYLIGDGEDTGGNSNNIKKFLEIENAEKGFGRHMKSATLLGDENDRRVLAEIFGDENTSVASEFDTLIAQSMLRFNKDIQRYLLTRTTTRPS